MAERLGLVKVRRHGRSPRFSNAAERKTHCASNSTSFSSSSGSGERFQIQTIGSFPTGWAVNASPGSVNPNIRTKSSPRRSSAWSSSVERSTRTSNSIARNVRQILCRQRKDERFFKRILFDLFVVEAQLPYRILHRRLFRKLCRRFWAADSAMGIGTSGKRRFSTTPTNQSGYSTDNRNTAQNAHWAVCEELGRATE
jgi:hypothetical protein